MIVFIERRFSRPARFLGIRRIAYEFYCPRSGRLLTEHGCIPPLFQIGALSTHSHSLKLTPREAEVLFWISQGKSNHDIGVILGAKTGTICKHVEHIFGKLNVENRTAAAVVALETCRSGTPGSESNPVQPWAASRRFYYDAALCVMLG